MSDNQLSSDILESQFGPTEVRVIRQDELERVICTLDAKARYLELSHVTFTSAIEKEFAEIYKQIQKGKSMGKAFREAGVNFVREDQQVSEVTLTPKLQEWFAASGKGTSVRTKIYAGSHKLHIADIFELYSPLVKWPAKNKPGV